MPGFNLEANFVLPDPLLWIGRLTGLGIAATSAGRWPGSADDITAKRVMQAGKDRTTADRRTFPDEHNLAARPLQLTSR
jgi:hypothetical protein